MAEKGNLVEKVNDLNAERLTTTNKLLHKIDFLIQAVKDEKEKISPELNQLQSLATLISHAQSIKASNDECFLSLHEKIYKLGKNLDKESVNIECLKGFNEMDKHSLNRMVGSYLYRTGAFDAASSFKEETKLDLPENEMLNLTELFHAIKALNQHDLSLASAWILKHRLELLQIRSSLEMLLVQVEFMSILQKGLANRKEAIEYAYSRFPDILNTSNNDPAVLNAIGCLMGALPWAGKIDRSPYTHLTGPDKWKLLVQTFKKDSYRAVSLPTQAALHVATRAACRKDKFIIEKQILQQGAIAVPTILKMNNVALSTGKGNWDGSSELCSDVPLPKDLQFHSIFSCPVNREQGSSSSNPPVLLACGHVVSKSTVSRLPRIGGGDRFKCPTCPTEQTEEDVQTLQI